MEHEKLIGAYTYLLKHKPSGRVYYGSRKSHAPSEDLFVRYFSSSFTVKEMVAKDGKQAFEFAIRRTFPDYRSAQKWEIAVLKRMRVTRSDKWINKTIPGPYCYNSDTEIIRRQRISAAMRIRWSTPIYRNKHENPSQEVRQKRSAAARLGNELRYGHTVKCKRRSKNTNEFKIINITRRDIVKRIHQNQASAYRKIGWRVLY